MPIYDYVCDHCGHRFEVIHGVHGEGPATCPNCGEGPVRKGFAPPTIHFKGSGWAKKDRSAAKRSAVKTGEASSTGAESGPDKAAADSTATATPKADAGSSSSDGASSAPSTGSGSSSGGSSAAD